MGTAYRVNDLNVVGEELDGEVVAVNLESGTYHSLPGSAGAIWACLSGGATVTQVVDYLTAAYDCAGVDLEQVVAGFIAELEGLKLVTATDQVPTVPAAPEPGRTPFQPPRVETFNDLQDILLLDPIHDVDAAGWPSAGPAQPA